jgi:hypothetical protein
MKPHTRKFHDSRLDSCTVHAAAYKKQVLLLLGRRKENPKQKKNNNKRKVSPNFLVHLV